jgi:hypothetical protein
VNEGYDDEEMEEAKDELEDPGDLEPFLCPFNEEKCSNS